MKDALSPAFSSKGFDLMSYDVFDSQSNELVDVFADLSQFVDKEFYTQLVPESEQLKPFELSVNTPVGHSSVLAYPGQKIKSVVKAVAAKRMLNYKKYLVCVGIYPISLDDDIRWLRYKKSIELRLNKSR